MLLPKRIIDMRRAGVYGRPPGDEGYSWPESYEDADRYLNLWEGDVGAGGWERVAGGSDGSWSVKMNAGVIKTITTEGLQFSPGHTIAVDLRWDGAGGGDLQVLFGLAGTVAYSIHFDSTEYKTYIRRDGAGKSFVDRFDVDGLWRPLEITWAADGTISWTLAGYGDSWLDPSPLPGRGIGLKAGAGGYQADYWRLV